MRFPKFLGIGNLVRLGGNITGWKKYSFYLTNSWAFSIGLGIALFSLDLGKELIF
jgi:hypothetical protein